LFRFPDHVVAEAFLQPLHRGGDLFARSIAPRPQPQLSPPRALQHGELDPELGDGRARPPFLDPRPDEPEQLRGAAQCVTDDRFALFRFAGFKVEPYPQMFGPRAAKAQLFREVAAQRPGDKQQSLAVLDRFAELAVHARKERRLPCHELIGLEASREQDSVPSVATELAFQLTRTDRRDISQRAQSEKIKSLELLGVERQLTR